MDKSEYNKIHNWIRYNYGKAIKCSFCDGNNAKRFEWALLKGCSYEKRIENYIQLCPSCHRKYDYTEDMRLAQSNIMKKGLSSGILKNPNQYKGKIGIDHPTSKKIINIDSGIIYNTVSEAAISSGLKISTLSMMLNGHNKNKTNLRFYEK